MPLLSTLASASARGYGFNLSVSNSEDENATGVSATGSVGSVTTSTTNFISTTGVSATASAGSASVQITDSSVSVNATGVSGTSAVGTATASSPPSAQYFATLYAYQSSSTQIGQDMQFWQWNPSTNSVTRTGGSSGNSGITSGGTAAILAARNGNTLAATSSKNSSNQWLVYTITGGYTTTTIDLYRMSSTGTLAASRAVAYTETASGSPTYTWGESLSIGHNDTRLAFAWFGSTNVAAIPRVFSLDKNQSTASATLSLISPITAPATSTSYKYRSAAVHPTENTVVFAAQQSASPYNNGRVYLYTNYGVSGSETQTLYTVTGAVDNNPQIFGSTAAWSPTGNYLIVVDGIRYSSSTNVGSRLYFYSYDGSALTLLQQVDLSFNSPKLAWGPQDAYVLCGGAGNLVTLERSGNTLTSSSSYPNSQQNRQMALNYNGSALFGTTDYASDNTNMRVFLMDSSNNGDVSSLAVSQTVSGSIDPSGFLHYYGVVSLPPLED